MTQQDDWRPEMARLTQRQDQLERQQRDSNRKVEALQRDGDALKRDVDRRMDSLRRETDRQFRDGERRVSSLERSRDTLENLFWFSMPLVAAVAVIIILIVAVIVSREQCQEPGEPEQRSPSSVDAPMAGSGGTWQPGFIAAGTPFRQHRRSDDINDARATLAGGHGNSILSTLHQWRTATDRVSILSDRPCLRHLFFDPARGPGPVKPLPATRPPASCRTWSGSRNSGTGPAPEPHTATGGFLRGTTACV